MQNILWNLFGIDVPNVMSDSVDEKKSMSEMSCRRERVKHTEIHTSARIRGCSAGLRSRSRNPKSTRSRSRSRNF